jgi:hypothetical protein
MSMSGKWKLGEMKQGSTVFFQPQGLLMEDSWFDDKLVNATYLRCLSRQSWPEKRDVGVVDVKYS